MIGIYTVPLIIVLAVVFGAIKKVDLFGSFTEGAKEGITSLISIAPSLIGLVTAVSMLEASGFFEILSNFLSPVCNMAGIPVEIVPLGFMRPFTGSGHNGLH